MRETWEPSVQLFGEQCVLCYEAETKCLSKYEDKSTKSSSDEPLIDLEAISGLIG